ncbi:MAG TPA: hypothetical protein ENJ82_17155 [Bacteroidetes bacterium]|nr:hypothetical protein [Bacteroidota bacterium]
MDINKEEIEEVRELFGKELKNLDPTEFDQLHKALQQKYHPDKFERFDDETVREMAKDKFQRIEKLAEKVRSHFGQKAVSAYGDQSDLEKEAVRYRFDDMKIEIVTKNKDLKYKLFGTYLRWLERGDKFQIPKTKAQITIDQNHQGNRVGFVETIRIYLSFTEADSIEIIIDWLYGRLSGQADALIIEGKRLPVDQQAMAAHIRQKARLQLRGPE